MRARHRAGPNTTREQPPKPGPVTAPEVARDVVRCRKCGAEVSHVQVGTKWQTRDPDGLPHRLTCTPGQVPDSREW